jgi:hypothetical protein
MCKITRLCVFKVLIALSVFSLSLSVNGYADMGRVYVSNEPVTVSEDSQKAIILHNFAEEILILGTDLKASKKTGVIRFIPFPSEPSVSLAPEGAFDKMSAMVKKYGLKYQQFFYSKGGPSTPKIEGVELRLNKKLGAHDMTLIKVNDASTFREWINNYFRIKGLPAKERYPQEEGIVDDYVKRGLVWFVLDYVEISSEPRFIEPVAYRFKSKELYYPLKTSNSFGGRGGIELFLILPVTLCNPGNEPIDPFSGALYKEQHADAQRPYGQRPLCLNLPVKASTSALMVKEEKDLDEIFSKGEDFFGNQKTYIQVVSYAGKYEFNDDIFADISTGLPDAVGPAKEEQGGGPLDGVFQSLMDNRDKRCDLKPERGACKAMFKRYYYDPTTKSCKSFFWGGCDGIVPFDSEQECRQCLEEKHK